MLGLGCCSGVSLTAASGGYSLVAVLGHIAGASLLQSEGPRALERQEFQLLGGSCA